MFYVCSTETWLEKRNNDINDPSSLNPGGICDSGLSLNRYLQAHPGDTGKCPSKLTAYISIFPTYYQRCITYTYVHACGYSFSTVVCYGYVCLLVYTWKSACLCIYLAVLAYCLAICLFPMYWFFSYMYTYWTNDFWFLLKEQNKQIRIFRNSTFIHDRFVIPLNACCRTTQTCSNTLLYIYI